MKHDLVTCMAGICSPISLKSEDVQILEPSSMRKLIGGADLSAEYVEYSQKAVCVSLICRYPVLSPIIRSRLIESMFEMPGPISNMAYKLKTINMCQQFIYMLIKENDTKP